MSGLYADPYGQEVVNLRIGNVSTKPVDKQRLSISISPRDLAQLCGMWSVIRTSGSKSSAASRTMPAAVRQPQCGSLRIPSAGQERIVRRCRAGERSTDGPHLTRRNLSGRHRKVLNCAKSGRKSIQQDPGPLIRRSRGARHHAIHGVFWIVLTALFRIFLPQRLRPPGRGERRRRQLTRGMTTPCRPVGPPDSTQAWKPSIL